MTSFLNSITKRKKTPEQLVTSACGSLDYIITQANHFSGDVSQPALPSHAGANTPVPSSSANEKYVQACDNLCKRLGQMKQLLYGDGKASDVDEEKVNELAAKLISDNFLLKAVTGFEYLPFEARKDTAHIFNNMMRRDICKFASYVRENYVIVERLIQGYSNADTALSCGSMLRECVRYDDISKEILYSDDLWLFFDNYVHLRNFEIAADSFSTLKALLTTNRNQSISGEFLDAKYEAVMQHYEKLLQSDNFVTRWMSLKLLGEILLDRRNRSVMVRYVSSAENLKNIMNLLRDRASNIQFEAFHVFKAFVANPNKPYDVSLILYKNKAKLISFLQSFQSDRDDAQFAEEKTMLIDMLSALTKPESSGHASSTSSSRSTGSDASFSPVSVSVAQVQRAGAGVGVDVGAKGDSNRSLPPPASSIS